MAKLTKIINVDSSALLKLASRLSSMKMKTTPALAAAINAIGANVVEEVVKDLVQQTGFDQNTVRRLIHVHPATAKKLEWTLDASEVMIPPSGDWSRPWAKRVTPLIDGAQLVKIKTSNDSDVCDFCEEIALGSPYTMAEAMKFQHKYTATVVDFKAGKDAGLEGFLHPNCRCILQPWTAFTKIPVTLGKRKDKMKDAVLSMSQLGKAVAKELKVLIRV